MSSGNAQIGKPAPEFKATAVVDGQFKEIKLSDYKGIPVLFCDRLMQIKDLFVHFLNFVVVGISLTPDPFSPTLCMFKGSI